MYHFFYNAFISIFQWVIFVWGQFNSKVKRSIEGRKRTIPQFQQFRANYKGKVLWVHAASLGEFEQGRPVMEKWRENFADYGIVLTFFSPSGYEIRKDYPHADLVTYLPLDTPGKAKSFLEVLKPEVALFIKYEFWFNLLNEAVKRQVKVVFISTIFRKDQVYFHRGSALFLPLLRKIQHFFVQNEQSKTLLEQHGIEAVTVAGDTRLDRVLSIKETPFSYPLIEEFVAGKPAIILGSTWYSDIEFLAPVLPKLRECFCLIFAPHHIDERSIEQIVELDPEGTTLLSKGDVSGSSHTLIIDEIGSLAKIYRYGRYVYVGGALHEGLHNILEPAVYGLPIFFARHTGNAKFQEALAMEVSGGALSLEAPEEMLQKIEQLEADDEAYISTGQKASTYVEEQAGATDLIFDYLKALA
ncbi:MAG: glycosyltransferase N-terminal domain-containing protein [Cytophagales bacterium]|nr:glycosyltransferase N-terminal domain-containing protein [Cytophagales bacterium]